MTEQPKFIAGGIATDERGSVRFVNSFDFASVRRFYHITNASLASARVWHGHKRERKWVYVAKGSAIVAAVEFDHDTQPSKTKTVHRFVLSDEQPGILAIPAGYANAFRILKPETVLLFFSSSTVEESVKDDFRFPPDYWGEELWNVEHQ